MKQPRVTILLPNYNNGPFLKECLDSVCSQSYSDFKLIMVDDGSTDNSIEVFNAYKDDRFQLVEKAKNSGIVDSLNVGLELLETEYMIRLDGDDYMTNDRLEKLVNFMEEHADFDVCGSGLQKFGEQEQTILFEKDWIKNRANMIFNHSVGHATLIFRSTLFSEKGHRYSNDFKYMEDYHLLFQMMNDAKCTSIDDVLYFYRQTEAHDPQKQMTNRKEIYVNFYKMILHKLGVKDVAKRAEIHVQLGRQIPITFPFRDFENHVNEIILLNDEQKMFPGQELKVILENKLRVLKFKMVDQGKLKLKDVGFNAKLLKYYLRSKV